MKKIKLLIFSLIGVSMLFSGCGKTTPQETGFTPDDMIYFIMVDRFMDSDPENNLPDVDPDDPRAFQGGDIKGITQQLDHIKSLGATAIWLTPIMENGPNGYHGYWIYDFYSVDPHFGSLDDFKELVDEAHNRDMKVILDYIVNHTGYDSPWLKDPDKKDWFNPDRSIDNWRDSEEVELGWLAGLPDLDQTNPDVETFFLENALWWIEETGIDGFRLDTVRHVPESFWTVFSSTIKETHPDFFLLGEVWDENTKNLENYRATGIDSITNYSLYAGIKNAFNPMPNMFSLANAFSKEEAFTEPNMNALFIDNHDNPRYTSLYPKNSDKHAKQALIFMYTYPNIPVLYYGTEVGMTGGADPDNRQFMEWDKTDAHELMTLIPDLAEIRKTYVEQFTLIDYEKEILVYEVSKNDKKLLVVINASSKEKEVLFDYDAKALKDYYSNSDENRFSNGSFNGVLNGFETLFLIVD